MAVIRNLRHPPIVEALIDVQFEPQNGLSVEQLEPFAQRLFDADFAVERIEALEAISESNGKDGAPPLQGSSKKLQGLVVSNSAANRIITVAPNRLSVAQRAPYDGWDSLYKTAEEAFQKFVTEAKPLRVKRIAARFINSVSVVQEMVNLDEYVQWSLGMPEAIALPIIEFNHRTVIHQQNQDLFGIVVFRDQRVAVPGQPAAMFIIDIDAFANVEMDVSFERVAEKLSAIRAFKNHIFFGMVTEKTLEKYA